MPAAGAGSAVAGDELLAVPPAETHSGQGSPVAVRQSAMQQQPAGRHSVGGRWAVAARNESAGGRHQAHVGWTAAETAASVALRSGGEARRWGGCGHRQVAVVAAVMAL